MTTRWTHQTEIEVLTTPEDYEAFQVRIHVQGDPGRPKAFSRSQMQWEAPEPASLDMLSFEFLDPATDQWRAPQANRPYVFHTDDHIVAAVDAWWEDHGDECWESLSCD
jgi:hypothetical protein